MNIGGSPPLQNNTSKRNERRLAKKHTRRRHTTAPATAGDDYGGTWSMYSFVSWVRNPAIIAAIFATILSVLLISRLSQLDPSLMNAPPGSGKPLVIFLAAWIISDVLLRRILKYGVEQTLLDIVRLPLRLIPRRGIRELPEHVVAAETSKAAMRYANYRPGRGGVRLITQDIGVLANARRAARGNLHIHNPAGGGQSIRAYIVLKAPSTASNLPGVYFDLVDSQGNVIESQTCETPLAKGINYLMAPRAWSVEELVGCDPSGDWTIDVRCGDAVIAAHRFKLQVYSESIEQALSHDGEIQNKHLLKRLYGTDSPETLDELLNAANIESDRS